MGEPANPPSRQYKILHKTIDRSVQKKLEVNTIHNKMLMRIREIIQCNRQNRLKRKIATCMITYYC